MIRIGQAVDIHPFAENRKLILGGVEIPYEKGLAGHSDADVLVHAIAESILGALALGDLGHHFPDTDPAYKGICSMNLLEEVCRMMEDRGYQLRNLDATILAEKPKMMPYIEAMRHNISFCLHTDTENVSIKATRGEKLGFIGREEGILCLCSVLVQKRDEK